MNQGKLEVVRQEMARVNVDILGISKLKWTGMGEFNSDDHYLYYCRQESLRRNGVAIMVNKRAQNVVFGCNLKNDRMISISQLSKSMPQPFNFSFFSVTGWGIDLDNCDIEWFALEMNRDRSVIFEIASKYCISYSFVDHDGYFISSEGFLPTVVDIMVI